MSGRKGQIHTKNRANTLRERAWKSMRIMTQFTIADLIRTSAVEITQTNDYENLKKWLKQLAVHGFIRKTGKGVFRRAGEYQGYQIVRNIGPKHPLMCDRCGCSLPTKICVSLAEKERNKETDKETNKERETQINKENPEVTHDAA